MKNNHVLSCLFNSFLFPRAHLLEHSFGRVLQCSLLQLASQYLITVQSLPAVSLCQTPQTFSHFNLWEESLPSHDQAYRPQRPLMKIFTAAWWNGYMGTVLVSVKSGTGLGLFNYLAHMGVCLTRRGVLWRGCLWKIILTWLLRIGWRHSSKGKSSDSARRKM